KAAAVLALNQHLSATGRIVTIMDTMIFLADCELLETYPLSQSSQGASATTDLECPAEPTPAAERIFTHNTPADLVAMCKGITSLQADLRVKKYLGHWLRLTADIEDVDPSRDIITVRAKDSNAKAPIALIFP